MNWTCRFSALSAAVSLAGAASLSAQDDAQRNPAAASSAEVAGSGSQSIELSELRKAIDSQSLKIEMLTREVSELRRKLSSSSESETSAPKPATAAPAAAEEKPAPTPSDPAQPEVRAAEATGGGVKHIVAKGETLTSIAKQYNIPLATLQSANKIQDGRKLQIGQVLSIPSPTDTSAEKKEKP